MPSTGSPPVGVSLPQGRGRCCRPLTSLPRARARREEGAPRSLEILTPIQEEVWGRRCVTQSYPFLVCKASKLAVGRTGVPGVEAFSGSKPWKLRP